MKTKNKKMFLSISALLGLVYFKKELIFYGVIDKRQIKKSAQKAVDVFGGGRNAYLMLMETASAESDLGKAIDKSWGVGVGLNQFDPIGFEDVQQRTSQRNKDLAIKHFGMNIDKMVIQDLRFSPLASMVFTRLKYLLVRSPIPSTVEDRAHYWKVWYNSTAGAGTEAHYISASKKIYA